MKKYINPALALASLVTATACTDLDVDVKSKYTEYPTSDAAMEAKMADVYYAFRGALGRSYNEIQTLASDEAAGISFNGDYYDDGRYAHPTLHNFLPDDGAGNYWSDLAGGITKCNQVIVDLGGEDADKSVTAPARAMRAFYHFILMDSYGDVPILDKIPDESEAVIRSPRKEVAEFIESELLDIIPYLNESSDESTYGKPNKWMAEALLVKLYINWAVYTADNVSDYDPANVNAKLDDCVKYCDDIISSGLFELGDDYRAKFLYNNGSQIKDFIYAMPYDCQNAQGLTYGRFRAFRKIDNGATIGYYGGKMSKSCAGNIAMNPDFADLFSLEGDQRNELVLGGPVFIHDAISGEPTTSPYLYSVTSATDPTATEEVQLEFTKSITLVDGGEDQLNVGANYNGWRQGWRSIKFYPNPNEYAAYNRNQSNDVPIFRFADILLTKAEAIHRGASATGGDTPMSLVNMVRTASSAPVLTSSPSLQDILDERGREFFDENWRRNDMIRFGTFESEYGFHSKSLSGARFDKTCRVLPVPQSILNENSNWTQNAGY